MLKILAFVTRATIFIFEGNGMLKTYMVAGKEQPTKRATQRNKNILNRIKLSLSDTQVRKNHLWTSIKIHILVIPFE